MLEVAAVLICMAVGLSYFAVKEDQYFKLQAKIKDGFNPNAKDGDGDGRVQDGTKWERSL